MLTGPPQMCPTTWRLSTMASGITVTWSLKTLIGHGHNNGTIVQAEAARFTFSQLVWTFLSQRGISWEAKGILLIVSPVGHIPEGRRVTHLGWWGCRAVCFKVRWQIPALLAAWILRLFSKACNPFYKHATIAWPSEWCLEDEASLFPNPLLLLASLTDFHMTYPPYFWRDKSTKGNCTFNVENTTILWLAFAQSRSFIGTDTPQP